MPSRPQYFHRLTEAIEVFEQFPQEWIDRRDVEEVLGVSTTVAWRILRRCGAQEGPGGALISKRDVFLEVLRRIANTPEFQVETARRRRVEDRVDQLARLFHSRTSKVAEGSAAKDLIDSRFLNLPAGVDLTPHRLIIDFQGAEDFLQKFGAVVFALQNDYQSIATYLDEVQK